MPMTFLTEVLPPKGPRSHSPEIIQARKYEIESLIKRGTLNIIPKEVVPPNEKILPGRFVVALKPTIDG